MNTNTTSGTEQDQNRKPSEQETDKNQESETQTSTSDSKTQDTPQTDAQDPASTQDQAEGVTDAGGEPDPEQEVPSPLLKVIQQIEELRRLVQSEQYLNNLAARTVQLMVRSETIPRLLEQELTEGRFKDLMGNLPANAQTAAVFDSPANIVNLVFGELCSALQSRHHTAGSVQSDYSHDQPTEAGLAEGVQPLRLPDAVPTEPKVSAPPQEELVTPPAGPSDPTEDDIDNMAFVFVNPPEREDDISTMVLVTPTIGPDMNQESIELVFEQFDGHGHQVRIQLKESYAKLAHKAYEERRHELRFGQAYWMQLVRVSQPETKDATS